MAEADLILNDLNSDDVMTRRKAVFTVGEKKIKEAIPKLIELLLNDPDNVVRNSAARALGKIPPEDHKDAVFEALEKALEDPNIHVRANACWALGNLKDPRAIPLLEKMVDPSQRFYTMSADPNAEMVDEAHASDKLKEEGMKSSDVIIAAVKAIGTIKHKNGIPALKKALGDKEDGTVRCAACLALGKIGSKEATPVLIKALSDKYWYVRRDAAKALMKLRDPQAAPALKPLLSDMYQEVRKYAKKALLSMGKGAAKTIFELYLQAPQDKDYQNYIKNNLKKEDIKKILEELIEEEKNPKKIEVYKQFLAKLQ